MYNLIVPEENCFNIIGRHTFIVDDFEDKKFEVGDNVVINNKECVIRGIEYSKTLEGKVLKLALLITYVDD